MCLNDRDMPYGQLRDRDCNDMLPCDMLAHKRGPRNCPLDLREQPSPDPVGPSST